MGIRLERILANVQHAGGSSSSSSSCGDGSSSGKPFKQKAVELSFMDRVCLSLEVQRQDSSEPLMTVNYNPEYVLDTGVIPNDYQYT